MSQSMKINLDWFVGEQTRRDRHSCFCGIGMSHDSEHLCDHPLSSFSPCVAVLALHVDVGLS